MNATGTLLDMARSFVDSLDKTGVLAVFIRHADGELSKPPSGGWAELDVEIVYRDGPDDLETRRAFMTGPVYFDVGHIAQGRLASYLREHNRKVEASFLKALPLFDPDGFVAATRERIEAEFYTRESLVRRLRHRRLLAESWAERGAREARAGCLAGQVHYLRNACLYAADSLVDAAGGRLFATGRLLREVRSAAGRVDAPALADRLEALLGVAGDGALARSLRTCYIEAHSLLVPIFGSRLNTLGPVQFEFKEQVKYELSPVREVKVLRKFDHWARGGRWSECIFYLQRAVAAVPMEMAVMQVAAGGTKPEATVEAFLTAPEIVGRTATLWLELVRLQGPGTEDCTGPAAIERLAALGREIEEAAAGLCSRYPCRSDRGA